MHATLIKTPASGNRHFKLYFSNDGMYDMSTGALHQTAYSNRLLHNKGIVCMCEELYRTLACK